MDNQANEASGGSRSIADDIVAVSPRKRRLLDTLEIHSKEVENAIRLTRQWNVERQDRRGLSLVFCGPPGVGKTHLARAALWSEIYTVDEFVIAPVGRFYVAYDLLLRLSLEDGQTLTATVNQAVGNAPLIVVDDVGQDVQLPFVAAALQVAERHARMHAFINYCYEQQVSLVITSNLKAGKELQDWIGPRCWDRLVEMAPSPYIFQFQNTPSYRKKHSGYTK